ncbi:bombesin receptor subtype-3-like [Amphiura filiformis]|uniref:bombesin receptor subtype-3-like n=1 Tax=Amphiura filiformis TaxID=82378 RepID=UPI003B20F0C6
MMDGNFTNNSDSSLNYEQLLYELACGHRSPNYYTQMILLAVFSFVGIVGNIGLLIVVWSDTNLRNTPNILLTNLAFADLMYILVTAPIRIEHELDPCWHIGTVWCAMKQFAPVVCQSACVFSLVALSRERYSAIVHGLQSRFSNRLSWTIGSLILLWIASCLCGMPYFWFSYVNLYTCMSVVRGSLSAQIYETLRLVFLFAIPCFLIAFHYSKMAKTLLASTKTFAESNSKQFVKQNKARSRLAYLAVTISVFFAVFWFPSVVYQMWCHFTKNEHHFKEARSYINTFRHVHYYMSLANSCLNPWVVFIMSSSHRRKLLKPFKCSKGKPSKSEKEAGSCSTFQSTNKVTTRTIMTSQTKV